MNISCPTLQRLGLVVLLMFGAARTSLGAEKLVSPEVSIAFDAANKLYEQGKFAEAAGAYRKLGDSGLVSPAVAFNLGNAFFKSGHIGQAISTYRRAERLTPRDPDLRANLQFARNQVQGPTLRPTWWQRGLATLSLNEWTVLSAVGLWLTFGLLTLREMRPAWARSLRTWILLSGLSTGLLLGCLALAGRGNALNPIAVVVVAETTVRNGPFDESPGAFTVHDGAELRVLDRKNDWLQVSDGTRRIGWMKSDAALVSGRREITVDLKNP